MPTPDSSYPAAIDNYVPLNASEVQPALSNKSAHVRYALAGVTAIQSTLGVNPQGGYPTVVARLDDLANGLSGALNDIITLQGDVGGLLTDVGNLQTDVGNLQNDKVAKAGDTMTGSLFLGDSNDPHTNPCIIIGDGNTGPDTSNDMLVVGSGNALANGHGALGIFGNGNTVGDGSGQTLIVGGSNTIASGASGAIVAGFGHNLNGSSQAAMFGVSHYAGPSGQGFLAGAGNSLEFSGQATVFGSGNWSRSANNSFMAGGSGNSVWGNYAMTLGGDGSRAVGDYSFVAGSGCVAGGSYAIAFGSSSQANGGYCLAGGDGVIVGYTESPFTISGNTVSIPGDVTTEFYNGSPILMYAVSGGSATNRKYSANVVSVPVFSAGFTTFIISAAPADHTAGTMLPDTGLGRYTLAWGSNINAHAVGCLVVGENLQVTGQYGLVVGYGHTVTGNPFIGALVGSQHTVTGDGYAFGNQHDVSGQYAAAFGSGNTVAGTRSMVLGSGNASSGPYSLSAGLNGNDTLGTACFALGSGNQVSGNYNTGLGQNNDVSNGWGNLAAGVSNTVSGVNGAVALGWLNVSSGFASMAVGYSNTASGSYSFAGGGSSDAGGLASFAFGRFASDGGFAGVHILTDSQSYTTTADFPNQMKLRFQEGFKLVKGDGVSADGVEYSIIQNSTSTTDATPTVFQPISFPADSVTLVEARVVARRTGGVAGSAGDSATYIIRARFKRIGVAAATMHDFIADYTSEDQAAWDVTFLPIGGSCGVQVTGEVDNDITWHTTTKVQRLF